MIYYRIRLQCNTATDNPHLQERTKVSFVQFKNEKLNFKQLPSFREEKNHLSNAVSKKVAAADDVMR